MGDKKEVLHGALYKSTNTVINKILIWFRMGSHKEASTLLLYLSSNCMATQIESAFIRTIKNTNIILESIKEGPKFMRPILIYLIENKCYSVINYCALAIKNTKISMWDLFCEIDLPEELLVWVSHFYLLRLKQIMGCPNTKNTNRCLDIAIQGLCNQKQTILIKELLHVIRNLETTY